MYIYNIQQEGSDVNRLFTESSCVKGIPFTCRVRETAQVSLMGARQKSLASWKRRVQNVSVPTWRSPNRPCWVRGRVDYSHSTSTFFQLKTSWAVCSAISMPLLLRPNRLPFPLPPVVKQAL